MQQISTNDRQIFNDKWIVGPGEQNNNQSFIDRIENFFGPGTLYILFTLGLAVIIIALVRHRRSSYRPRRKRNNITELKEEIRDLEDESHDLSHELETVKHLEEDIKNKIKNIEEI